MTPPRTHIILLVEDGEDDAIFMRKALKKAGIVDGLRVVTDGEKAIDYLAGNGGYADRQSYPRPALIFLDLKLPRVSGLDVLRWIRTQPELDLVTVIVLTASQQEMDVRQACALRANSYLVKPSNPNQLGDIAELTKQYWLRLNQPTASIAGIDDEHLASRRKLRALH